MDTLAHGLWTYAIYQRRKYVWHAVLFGVLPDLLSFGVFFVIRIFSGNLTRGPPAVSTIPQWIHISYNITHSLAVFLLVFAIVYFLTKEWLWPLVGWAIHIIIDFPTHSIRFFPTPILWPIADVKFDGISWATSWFMLLNYIALIAVFIAINYNKKRKK